MKLLQKILVPVDFGQASQKAFDTAVMLSGYFLSEITLLHVIPADKVSDETEKLIMKNIRSEMNKLLNDSVSENVKSVELLIEKGNPIEQITEVAENKEMNLIIMGEGNHSENEHFKLGSTTERMMQKNEIPLMVVKNESVKPLKKILCPVDFSESSKRALTNAIFLSNRFGAQLTIMNVFTPVEIFSYWINVDNKKENQLQLQQQKTEFDHFLKDFHINKDSHVVKIAQGEPEEEILKEIKNQGIDLLIMGTTGKTGLSKIFLGSVTEKVTREVPCNFIVTNEAEISGEIFESNLKIIESLIVAARNHFDNEETEKAIEKYMHVLNHHPDSVPALIGLMQCYRKTGNQQKANLFRDYARKVINRIWGTEFNSLHDLLS
jgi:nucleotide-binding universal stress UspA family protein